MINFKVIIFIFLLFGFAIASNYEDPFCHKVLRELGDSHSKFIQCVTVNSAPVKLCEICPLLKEQMDEKYGTLQINCSTIYFDKDRINMVASVQSSLASLWNKAFCEDCSNSNHSEIFSEKYFTLQECLGQHKEQPCENCLSQYSDLNSFYIQLDQHNNGKVCFDLQDQMNRTRTEWSKTCCKRDFNMTLFSITLAIMSSLPILFYSSTYIITKRQERNHGLLDDEEDEIISTPQQQPTMNSITVGNQKQDILTPSKQLAVEDEDDDISTDDENLLNSKIK